MVHAVVSDFYDRVQLHPALSQPFSIVSDWSHHKAHLAHFWWVTLGGERYRDEPYSVAEKHAVAGFTPALLQEWLALFQLVLTSHLSPEIAEQWYARAEHIGRSLVFMHEFRARKINRSGTNIACR
jgi:hemoglobin